MASEPGFLGEILRSLESLQSRGYSLRQLGRESGIAEGTLRRTFVNRERTPRASTIARVYQALSTYTVEAGGPRTIRRSGLAPSREALRQQVHPPNATAFRGVQATGDTSYPYQTLAPAATADMDLEQYADRYGIDPNDLVSVVYYVSE